jgi:hypothetical protein
MREREESLPLGVSAITKGIERSSGPVSDCLERLAHAADTPVRRADKPRGYDMKAEAPGTPS